MDLSRYRSSAVIVALLLAGNSFAAQAWYSPISINSGQVPSTQTDFPVLVSQTDARFKTIGNGGHVANASGFDIRPYSDTALTSALTYELERYNASTGEVVMWVKVGSLSSSTTPIYLGYGDTGLTTDGSSTSTWSNNFRGVWHFKDGSSLTLTDSSGNGKTLTNNNTVTAGTGKIDGAASFASASSQYLSNTTIGIGTAVTFSAWVNQSGTPQANAGVMTMRGATGYCLLIVDSTVDVYIRATTDLSDAGHGSVTPGTWYYVVLTYDSSAGLKGYQDASNIGSVGANGNANTDPTTINIGRDSFGTRYTNGLIDEARMANVARSADWITTEFNNQNAPGTFETLGTEVSTTGSSSAGWFQFIP